MDFVALAQELEGKTITTYQNLADQCTSHEGIRRILLMLMDDHKQHVEGLKRSPHVTEVPLADPGVFKEVRQLLEKIQTDQNTFSCDIDQLKLYYEARDLVLEKKELYQKIQQTVEDEAGRRFVGKLIQEENKQAFVLSNIIEMVERPQHWLEDAEFTHLDEY